MPAGDHYLSIYNIHHLTGNGKSQTCTGSKAIYFKETLENSFLILRFNADTSIFYYETYDIILLIFLALQTDHTLFGKFPGIIQQKGKHTFHPGSYRLYHRDIRRGNPLQFHTFFLLPTQLIYTFKTAGIHIHRFFGHIRSL